MTVATGTIEVTRRARAEARVEVAWTVSTGSLGGDRSYSSAVLHVVCAWDADDPSRIVTCEASLRRAGTEREVSLPARMSASTVASGRWTHVTVGPAGGRAILSASFEHGRLVYCTSAVPELAGLAGGTYDAPTGILELYEG